MNKSFIRKVNKTKIAEQNETIQEIVLMKAPTEEELEEEKEVSKKKKKVSSTDTK